MAAAFLLLLLLVGSVTTACQRVPGPTVDALRFPTPDRPVARIVTSTYSNEVARDAKGEAERVMERLGVTPGMRVADIGAGNGYYTVRLARRLGAGATIFATDVETKYLEGLGTRLEGEAIFGVTLVLGAPRDPRLPPASIDLALLSHVYHEIENPFEFFYRLHAALGAGARVAIIDNDKPTQDHGTPPSLLRCEMQALGYREVDFTPLDPADGYLAVFAPPAALPPLGSIRPCPQAS